MRTLEAVSFHKEDDILKNLLGSQLEEILPAQHTFATRALEAALAWYPTFTELYKEIKGLHKAVLPLENIEFQYLQGNDDNNEDMYENSRNKFFQELPKLLDQYERKFVAFINDEIFVSDDEESLVLNVVKKHGNISFYFDKVMQDYEEHIEITSGKLVARE